MLNTLLRITVAGIAIAAFVMANAGGVQASTGAKTLPVSLIAKSRANYGVDSVVDPRIWTVF